MRTKLCCGGLITLTKEGYKNKLEGLTELELNQELLEVQIAIREFNYCICLGTRSGKNTELCEERFNELSEDLSLI